MGFRQQILSRAQIDPLISRLVVTATLNPNRFVDLQLGHWGFTPRPNEGFLVMHNRLKDDITAWWNGDFNAVKDNGPGGIDRMNTDFRPRASEQTYHFTMSFDATRPFPREYVSHDDVKRVPLHPLLSVFGIFAAPATFVLNVGRDVASIIPGTPSDLQYANWAVGVANDHLGKLDYQFTVPRIGWRIPRSDMLPILAIFSAGMSGVDAEAGGTGKNDGVVDTASMQGPKICPNNPIKSIDEFDTAAVERNKGVYWDLGLTEGIDHADQVGVFTDDATVRVLHNVLKEAAVMKANASTCSIRKSWRYISFLESLYPISSDGRAWQAFPGILMLRQLVFVTFY